MVHSRARLYLQDHDDIGIRRGEHAAGDPHEAEDVGARRASSLATESGGLGAHGTAQVGFTNLSIGGTSWHTVGRRIHDAKAVDFAAI